MSAFTPDSVVLPLDRCRYCGHRIRVPAPARLPAPVAPAGGIDEIAGNGRVGLLSGQETGFTRPIGFVQPIPE